MTQQETPGFRACGNFDVVALAGSAGGLHALSHILSALPVDFPAAIVAVLHLAPAFPSHAAAILSRNTSLQVHQAAEGICLQPSHVYIAAPDYHLLIRPGGRIVLTHTQTVHYVRPSADRLFTSVAETYAERAIAVVLSGTGRDGSGGVLSIKDHGGLIIAQKQETAEFSGMPDAAVKTRSVDFILELEEIAAKLIELVT
jgi:two-component system chemotaxis response regulator CheB